MNNRRRIRQSFVQIKSIAGFFKMVLIKSNQIDSIDGKPYDARKHFIKEITKSF